LLNFSFLPEELGRFYVVASCTGSPEDVASGLTRCRHKHHTAKIVGRIDPGAGGLSYQLTSLDLSKEADVRDSRRSIRKRRPQPSLDAEC